MSRTPAAEPNNEPAAPVTSCADHQYLGLTIRDYFAAAALQGFMANKDRPQNYCPFDDSAYCYRIADAMLAERDK